MPHNYLSTTKRCLTRDSGDLLEDTFYCSAIRLQLRIYKLLMVVSIIAGAVLKSRLYGQEIQEPQNLHLHLICLHIGLEFSGLTTFNHTGGCSKHFPVCALISYAATSKRLHLNLVSSLIAISTQEDPCTIATCCKLRLLVMEQYWKFKEKRSFWNLRPLRLKIKPSEPPAPWTAT